LFAKLKGAKADGTYTREINRIEKQDLLIIDDRRATPFGLQPSTLLMTMMVVIAE